MSISEIDKELIWHPFTQEKTAPDVICIDKASGSYIYDKDGKSYLDLISSWWVNIHGHGNPYIAKAIYDQAQQLEHVIFAGFTHAPAVNLCKQLTDILPSELKRFFFSDNGSTAVEVALKLSYQYWRNKGEHQRKIFVSLDGGYHGDTFGAMSVGRKSGFHNQFEDLFFKVLSVPYPYSWAGDEDIEEKEQASLNKFAEYCKDYSIEISALILEPIVQGASGMRMCRPQFVKELVNIAIDHGVLVIFDEIMTGFGRTGKLFAFEHIGVVPDFICLSKGLTGGFLPLALTVTTEDIYKEFLSDSFDRAFAHGHSYTANPLACSAAIASLKLLLDNNCITSLDNINQAHIVGVNMLSENLRNIEKVRIQGTIAAFDVKVSAKDMVNIRSELLESGLLLRPLGNTIYLLPPYCLGIEDLNSSYDKILTILRRY